MNEQEIGRKIERRDYHIGVYPSGESSAPLLQYPLVRWTSIPDDNKVLSTINGRLHGHLKDDAHLLVEGTGYRMEVHVDDTGVVSNQFNVIYRDGKLVTAVPIAAY